MTYDVIILGKNPDDAIDISDALLKEKLGKSISIIRQGNLVYMEVSREKTAADRNLPWNRQIMADIQAQNALESQLKKLDRPYTIYDEFETSISNEELCSVCGKQEMLEAIWKMERLQSRLVKNPATQEEAFALGALIPFAKTALVSQNRTPQTTASRG